MCVFTIVARSEFVGTGSADGGNGNNAATSISARVACVQYPTVGTVHNTAPL